MRTDVPMGPHCPGCGQEPMLAFAEQAFCGNDSCKIVTWNPSMTLDELLEAFQIVDLPDWLSGEQRG